MNQRTDTGISKGIDTDTDVRIVKQIYRYEHVYRRYKGLTYNLQKHVSRVYRDTLKKIVDVSMCRYFVKNLNVL